MEVFSKVVTSEENLTFTFIGAIGWRNIPKADLIVIVELTKIIKSAIEVETELHVAGDFGVFVFQAHWTLNHIFINCDGWHISLVQVAHNLTSNVEPSSFNKNYFLEAVSWPRVRE